MKAWFTRHPAFLVFLVSLTVRVLTWFWVVSQHVPTVLDEDSYLDRAAAWVQIWQSLIAGTWPTSDRWDAVYGFGVWPPLHPMLLSLGWVLGGTGGARLVVVLASAATTPMVFALSRRCGLNARVSLLAGLLHAFYPEVVAFSHYLWSETVFTALAVAGVLAVLRALDASRNGSSLRWMSLGGLAVGAAGLCRATVAPLALVLAVWTCFAWRGQWRRAAGWTAVFAIAFGFAIAPWMLALRSQEGRWMPLSTSGGFNLLLGNNRFIPDELGSGWGTSGALRMREELRRTVALNDDQPSTPLPPYDSAFLSYLFSRDRFCREEAFSYIRANPQEAVRRAWRRVRLALGPDIFLVRHMLNEVYPLVPAAAATTVWALAWGAFGLVLAAICLAVWLPLLPSRLWLLLLAGAALTAPVLVTISNSRMRLPALVLALPLAAIGLSSFRAVRQLRAPHTMGVTRLLGATLTGLVLFVNTWEVAGVAMRHLFFPSTFYRGPAAFVAYLTGSSIETTETVELTAEWDAPACIALDLLPAGEVRLANAQSVGPALVRLDDQPIGTAKKIWIASNSKLPVRLSLRDPRSGEASEVTLDQRTACRRPQPTGIRGVAYSLAGCHRM